MLHAKQGSKRKSHAKSAVLGVAGALSLAGGASGAAVGPPGNTPTENTASVIIGEEEISDVSLATFHVFDNDNAAAHRPVLRLAQRTRSRLRQGCGGCAGDCGGGGPHVAQAAQAAEGRMGVRASFKPGHEERAPASGV